MDLSESKSESAHVEFLREYPRTGPGTLGGRVLRHYWHPLCLSGDLRDLPYPVRMLGEDLVAFRAADGRPALVARRCPHRLASLEYAQVEPGGLRCSYHGWTFDASGRCVDMPLEPANSRLMAEARIRAYAVQDWRGIVWCYMGERQDAPPPLPKIDIMAREDGELILSRGDVRNYSYLNFMENFADMGHIYVTHMLEPGKVPESLRPHVDNTVDTDWRRIVHRAVETGYGLKCVLVHDTADANRKFVNTWGLGFPYYFRFGGVAAGLPPDFTDDRREGGGMVRIIDDEHFEIFRYTLMRPGNAPDTFYPRAKHTDRGLAEGIRGLRPAKPYDARRYPGWEGLPPVEDLVLQESQGAIPPRHLETLGTSDAGVVLLRKIWRRSIDAVRAGGAPKALETDAEGVFEPDSFKGFLPPGEIELGPKNMPSSRGGRGLIRDAQGRLVFG